MRGAYKYVYVYVYVDVDVDVDVDEHNSCCAHSFHPASWRKKDETPDGVPSKGCKVVASFINYRVLRTVYLTNELGLQAKTHTLCTLGNP
jgi:hypothetical protein